MLKKGIYRSVHEHYTSERHGGATLRDGFFWFLCFYLPDKSVGLFGASKHFIKPYLENRIHLNGKLTFYENDKVDFDILNNDNGVTIQYTGQIRGDLLYLKYFHEDKPEEVFEDVFEYIGEG
jgi:hypothetical protein